MLTTSVYMSGVLTLLLGCCVSSNDFIFYNLIPVLQSTLYMETEITNTVYMTLHAHSMHIHKTHTHSRDYWFARVSNGLCYDGHPVHLCTFNFTFCQALPIKEFKHNCYGAAVCQTGIMDGDPYPWEYKDFSYSMGQFNNSTGFYYSE